MSTATIAITGANGFVGSALCQLLYSRNIDYRALLRSGSESQIKNSAHVDYNSCDSIKSALSGCNTLIHLIAKTHSAETPESLADYRKINVELSRTIALACREAEIKRVVFLSSIKVNGEETKKEPFDHNSEPAPTTAYGISKHEAEIVWQETCGNHGIELVIIRPPLIFAAHAKGNIANLRKAIEHYLPLPLNSIDNKRSIIDLHELCELIYTCSHISDAVGQTVLASTDCLSTPDLIRKIERNIEHKALLFPFPVSLLKLLAKITGKQELLGKLCNDLVIDDRQTKQFIGLQGTNH